MKPIIEIENVGKKYKIGAVEPYLSLRDSLANLSPFKRKPSQKDFWALNNVNFKVEAGDAIGIIGRNGAGKSTLLKILSQITPPTTGKITMRGRVASLLEVGTGFHPELTGQENIYLNGAILGMSRAEIKKKFDEIVSFAGVEQFLNTPVKRYSSGMYVRLAFAVAAHLEPEILIVDEVLAVGDAEFQRKCLGRMEKVSKEGRTVIFVSHNMGAIRQLCSKGILLEKGKSTTFHDTESLINAYQNQIIKLGESNKVEIKDGLISFNNFQVNNNPLSQTPDVFSFDPLKISFSFKSKETGGDLCVGYGIKSKRDGGSLVFIHNHLEGKYYKMKSSGKIEARLAMPNLAPGEYSLDLSIWIDGHNYVDNQEIGSFIAGETPSFGSKISVSSFPSTLLIGSEWKFLDE
jgi:lipopolysaccharide transport system ATP-binding protein